MSMKELNGRAAVITGAGSGFGREIALACAAHKMNLILADIDALGLDETARLVPSTTAVITQVCDVANADEVETLAELAYRKFGDVHLVFNNAGVFSAGPVWKVPLADWSWVMAVNVMGIVHGIRSFVPRMLERGQPGHIINTASLGGFVCPPGFGVYAVSKHAVVAMTECLYHDLRQSGSLIGVSLLCPAFVATSLPDARRKHTGLDTNNPEGDEITEHMRGAMHASNVTAVDVARMAIEAVLDDRFYVFTHPRSIEGVKQRFEDVLAGRSPVDPLRGVRPASRS